MNSQRQWMSNAYNTWTGTQAHMYYGLGHKHTCALGLDTGTHVLGLDTSTPVHWAGTQAHMYYRLGHRHTCTIGLDTGTPILKAWRQAHLYYRLGHRHTCNKGLDTDTSVLKAWTHAQLLGKQHLLPPVPRIYVFACTLKCNNQVILLFFPFLQ